MSLAWNTKRLMEEPAGGQKVEYHLLSGRRLRDGAIISADPDHSSAGEWVVSQAPYAVSVLTRPTYALPQQLCLSFTCHTRKVLRRIFTLNLAFCARLRAAVAAFDSR
jgi:hypothetical protein